jgi:O-antigen ligase
MFYLAALIYTISVYGSMAMMSIAAGIVFLVFIVELTKEAYEKKFTLLSLLKKLLFNSKLFYPTFFLSLACIWSLVWAKLSNLNYYGVTPKITFLSDIAKLWHLWFSFVLSAVMLKLSKENFYKILKIWLFSSLFIAVFGLFQHYFPIVKPMVLPHIYEPEFKELKKKFYGFLFGSYHVTGLSGFHLSFISIFIFPTTTWFNLVFLRVKNFGFTKKNILIVFICILFFIVNILTFSKIAFVTTALVLALVGFLALNKKQKIILISLIFLFLLGFTQTSVFKLRVKSADTIYVRFAVWQANFDMIKKFPWFGVGWHHNSELSKAYYEANSSDNQIRPFVSHAHNNILDQWSSTGTLGLIFFLWWNFTLVFISLKLLKKFKNYNLGLTYLYKVFVISFLVAFLGFHIQGLTQTNFWDSKCMHQLSWVTAFILALNYKFSTDEV